MARAQNTQGDAPSVLRNFYGHFKLRRMEGASPAPSWIFMPAGRTFSYIGNYPFFSVDPAKGRLSTYERGGYGGMVYQKTEYAFIDGKITAVASEKQELTEREGVFRKKLYQRKTGQLRLFKTETVKAPAAR